MTLGIILYFRKVKVYYNIPGTDNELADKMIGMLYENFKLHILLAVAPVAKITDKEDGMIVIERKENDVEIKYVGWSAEVELILKYCIAGMKEKQKIKFA